jgi:Fe-S-cluster-containing hydrogenase component 2
MPWVNQDLCVACGICVDDCPVGAITQNENQKAFINENECIRCGKCHEVCPEDAVRHDSERIPEQVAANIEKTRKLLKHYDDPNERWQFMERMIRYYKKEQKVADLTMEKLTAFKVDLGKSAKPISPDVSNS